MLPGLLGPARPGGAGAVPGAGRRDIPGARAARRRAGPPPPRSPRTGRRYVVTALAAAALALVAGLGAGHAPAGRRGHPDAGPRRCRWPPCGPVAGAAPVHAEIGLTGTPWGTEVTMRCGYDRRDGPPQGVHRSGWWRTARTARRSRSAPGWPPPATTCGSPAPPASPTANWSAWNSSAPTAPRSSPTTSADPGPAGRHPCGGRPGRAVQVRPAPGRWTGSPSTVTGASVVSRPGRVPVLRPAAGRWWCCGPVDGRWWCCGPRPVAGGGAAVGGCCAATCSVGGGRERCVDAGGGPVPSAVPQRVQGEDQQGQPDQGEAGQPGRGHRLVDP